MRLTLILILIVIICIVATDAHRGSRGWGRGGRRRGGWKGWGRIGKWRGGQGLGRPGGGRGYGGNNWPPRRHCQPDVVDYAINDGEGMCECTCGYSGPDCGVDSCNNRCLNNAPCNNGICDCPPVFSGEDCGTKIKPVDLCENITCLNDGQCVSGICKCTPGYGGEDCNKNPCAITDCPDETRPCVPVSVPGGYACSCVERISGSIVCTARSVITPRLAKLYGYNLDVTTTIPGVPGKNLTISFIDISFEVEVNCPFDYLKIEGIQYCGFVKPEDITLPTGAGTQVRFVTDHVNNYEGYTLTYQYIDAVSDSNLCKNGGTPTIQGTCNCMSGFEGSNCEFSPILTPAFKYDGDQNTSFILPGFPEKELVLTFDDDFSIETTDGNCNDALRTNCTEDYVEIEGTRYCGGVAPGPITIPTGNGTTVRFVSNDDGDECPTGFTLTYVYRVDLCENITCLNDGQCVSGICKCTPGYGGEDCNKNPCAITDCPDETRPCVPVSVPGGYACSCVERISGSIVCTARSVITPRLAKLYGYNLDVTTTIPGVPGKNLTISFIDISFEVEVNCPFDYLKIEGIQYCGFVKPEDITLPTGAGTQVRFVTDHVNNYEGYTLTYQYIDAVSDSNLCKNGGTPTIQGTCNCMSGFEGSNCEFSPILTPAFKYDQNTSFILPGFPEKELVLTFDDDFSIETTDGNCNDALRTNCTEDYVEIEGTRYCGGVAPGPITIPTGNGTTVRFVSNDDGDECPTGFTLTYVYRVDLCENITCLNDGQCVSGICKCTPGYGGEDCNKNPCAITDCPDETRPCVPVSVPGGYACSCVERISESIVCTARSVITPRLAKLYGYNLDVTTTIPGVPGKNLTISFIDISIDPGVNCPFDYLKIEGIQYCGFVNSEDITLPTGAGTQVRFVTDDLNNYEGYTLAYQYIDAVSDSNRCKNGGTPTIQGTCNCMSGFEGINCEFSPILRPAFKYDGDQNTSFILPGFPEKELVLTFDDDFSIETTDGNCNDTLRTNCTEDYVEIEGTRYCGGVAPGPITIPTGNGTTVRFVSNDDGDECPTGFTLTYVYRDP